MLPARGAILTSVAVAATTIGTILVLGTAALRKDSGNTARPTPAPEFASFDSASRATILAYARTLSFSTAHGSNDTRRLSPSCRTCPPGPIATVDPEIGSHVVPLADLAKGRIIARLINQDTVSINGLAARDTTYVWAENAQGRWRAMLIPTRADRRVVERGFIVTRHAGADWTSPEARWMWNSEVGVSMTETVWLKCDEGCCEVRPHRPRP